MNLLIEVTGGGHDYLRLYQPKAASVEQLCEKLDRTTWQIEDVIIDISNVPDKQVRGIKKEIREKYSEGYAPDRYLQELLVTGTIKNARRIK